MLHERLTLISLTSHVKRAKDFISFFALFVLYRTPSSTGRTPRHFATQNVPPPKRGIFYPAVGGLIPLLRRGARRTGWFLPKRPMYARLQYIRIEKQSRNRHLSNCCKKQQLCIIMLSVALFCISFTVFVVFKFQF